MLCVITPIAAVRPRANPCAMALGRYWSLFTIASTAARLSGATGTLPLSTRDTVLDDTPAARAISWIVMVLLIVFSERGRGGKALTVYGQVNYIRYESGVNILYNILFAFPH